MFPRHFILIALLLPGCAQYTQSQLDLLTQARKGLSLAQQSQAAMTRLADQLYKSQRQSLDDAFDADVRERPALEIPFPHLQQIDPGISGPAGLGDEAIERPRAIRSAVGLVPIGDEAQDRKARPRRHQCGSVGAP